MEAGGRSHRRIAYGEKDWAAPVTCLQLPLASLADLALTFRVLSALSVDAQRSSCAWLDTRILRERAGVSAALR